MGLNELDIFHVVNCGAFLLLSRNKSLLSRGRGGAQGRAEHKITVSATPVQKPKSKDVSHFYCNNLKRVQSMSQRGVAACPRELL